MFCKAEKCNLEFSFFGSDERKVKGPKFFEGGVGKREVTFFKGVAIILHKNKLKSEYLMTKKLINKLMFFSVITKNSNWKFELRI